MTATGDNTLTAEKIRHLTDRGLGLLAEAIAFYIDTMDIVPDYGLYGDAHDSLHVVALEMNRRHGHASSQTRAEIEEALQTIAATDDLLNGSGGDMDVDWSLVHRDRARAFGVLIDHGPTELEWREEQMGGYSWEDVREGVEYMALREGLARGFDHAPVQPERFIPVDAGVPPF